MKIYLPISFGIDALLLFFLRKFIIVSEFSIIPLFILVLSVFIAVLYRRAKNEILDFHVNSLGMTEKEKEEFNVYVSNFLLFTLPFYILLIFFGNAFLKIFLSLVLIFGALIGGNIFCFRKKYKENQDEKSRKNK